MPKDISNKQQQQIWEKEHAQPHILPQMDAQKPSSGVRLFYDWLTEKNVNVKKLCGLEMACGKGRNVLWLAQQGIETHGFDFSYNAIKEAQERAATSAISNAHFAIHDATQKWPYEDDSLDFIIDCFGSTDIVEEKDRAFARKEIYRILKPNGYLLLYLLSTDDEFHKEMIQKSPTSQKNAFLHQATEKFEKVYDEKEIISEYNTFTIIEKKRVKKTARFFKKNYRCKHFWVVLQKS